MNILIENLVKTFGTKTALNIQELNIKSGELIGIVGNNGAGKTTLFRLMLNLIKGDSGSVRFAANGDLPMDGGADRNSRHLPDSVGIGV